MRRREFITLLGGAVARPLAARAQQAERMRRIGVLMLYPENDAQGQLRAAAFRQGLQTLGWVVGRNVQIEYRSAEGQPDRLAAAARDLASLSVDVIATSGSGATRAAQQATTTIPIVMIAIGDPVRAGFVPSLARPGGNITGNTILGTEMSAKRVQLLKELIPGVSRVAFLWNPNNNSHLAYLEEWRRHLRRPHSQGRQAHRPAGAAIDQIRVCHQPSNCAIARD